MCTGYMCKGQAVRSFRREELARHGQSQAGSSKVGHAERELAETWPTGPVGSMVMR